MCGGVLLSSGYMSGGICPDTMELCAVLSVRSYCLDALLTFGDDASDHYWFDIVQ